MDPVNSDCQKGFISQAGLTRHCNAVHKHKHRPSHPSQHHRAEGATEDENTELPEGAYYIKHPVLDGGYSFWILSVVTKASSTKVVTTRYSS